jgi:cytochrome P450
MEGKVDSGTRKDFFHWLWEARHPDTGKGYTVAELNAECEGLLIAGADTTATVISALFFYLCRNPRIQNRLANEIAHAFSSYDGITSGSTLQSCEYLTAVLYEGLRMAPPVGADLSRRVLTGGTTVEGRYLPEGTMVSSAAWSLHYDDDYYREPLEFLPERWIVGEAASTIESVELAQSAFCAFSTGPRGCVGKNMAWLEMRIVMAKAVWRYELKQDPDNNLGGGSLEGEWGRQRDDQYQTYDIFVSNRKGPMVKLKERLHE